MTDTKLIELPVEWDAVSFPASRSYIARIVLNSVQSITSIDERDIYRHLVDRNAQGRIVWIPDDVSEEEANAFEVSPVTARQASLQPKSGSTQSQKIRFLLGEIWQALPGEDKGTKENYYQERSQQIVLDLIAELETLQRANHYEGAGS